MLAVIKWINGFMWYSHWEMFFFKGHNVMDVFSAGWQYNRACNSLLTFCFSAYHPSNVEKWRSIRLGRFSKCHKTPSLCFSIHYRPQQWSVILSTGSGRGGTGSKPEGEGVGTHPPIPPVLTPSGDHVRLASRNAFLLPTAREGYVFTGVCHSVHNRPYGHSATAHPCWLLGRYASYWNAFLFLLQWRLEKSVLKKFQFTTVIGVMGLFTNAMYKRDPTKITNSNVFQSKNQWRSQWISSKFIYIDRKRFFLWSLLFLNVNIELDWFSMNPSGSDVAFAPI